MKKIIFLFALLTLNAGAFAQDKQLVILHTSDTHSCVYPLNPNLKDTTVAGRGGFLRRIEMLRQQRQQNPDLLLFDCGDFSQGSSYYTVFQGDVEVGLMNRMGYDAATIGNHEFDYGLDNMARLFRMANFPIVCSNYDVKGTVLEGLVKPYLIIKRNGVKIGVFALSPMMDGLVEKANCQGLTYLDPVAKTQEMVSLLKGKMKCDMVICLSHIGWDSTNGPNDQEVFAKTRGVDLVLGGHSHTYADKVYYVTNLDGQQVPVDHQGKHGIWIGRLVVDLKKK
ncbi:MAG: metallophosphatase [Prevotella sp.]|nr:metallophosphatase [Prevotella sp.]